MKYILKNKEIDLTDEEVQEIVKQSTSPTEEKKVGLEIKNRWTGDVIFTSTKTTWKEAVEEAVVGEANLRAAELCGANLREADLREADLREADLWGADLCGANLREADLREADLYGANLRAAELCEADLCGAEMQEVKLLGKGGTTRIKKNQVDDFMKAIGVIVE